MPMTWEKDLKPIFRPEDFHWGKLKANPDKCAGEVCGYKEFGINPELSACPEGHQANAEEGLKAINHKLSNKLTKAIPRGDPYCEEIFEFKNE